MRKIKDFESFDEINDSVNESDGNFDVVRLTVGIKRAIKMLNEGKIDEFITFFGNNVRPMLNTREARSRGDLINRMLVDMEAAKERISVEDRRKILDAFFPGMLERIDQNPKLKEAYGV